MLLWKKVVLSVSLLSLLTGCAGMYRSDAKILSHHQIYVTYKGELVRPDLPKYPISDQKRIKEYVDGIVKNMVSENPERIMIFVHGGLNNHHAATSNALNVLYGIRSDNKNKENRQIYPIFVGWRSDGLSNYGDHLVFLKNDGRRIGGLSFVSLLEQSIRPPFVLIEDVSRSVINMPISSVSSIKSQWSLLNMPLYDISSEERAAQLSHENLDKEKIVNINCNHRYSSDQDQRADVADYLYSFNPASTLIGAATVNGLGRGSWQSMKRRSDLLLSNDQSFEGSSEYQTALLFLLQEIEKNSQLKTKKIDLIGHSMGAIVVNNILMRMPYLEYENIVYMGAATSLKEMSASIVPVLSKNKNINFYNLSLDPYNEISETGDFPLSLISPRGSLLIYIDSYLQRTGAFTDRTAGNWFNVVRAVNSVFPEEVRNRVHLTCFGKEFPDPIRHGDFNERNFWRVGFWKGDSSIPDNPK